MGKPTVRVGVVDIGTNSMRLLITDGVTESGRWVEVTGLGRGVGQTGVLAPDAVDTTLAALARFGAQMTALGVDRRYAMATSASRDAANRDDFFDRAEKVLGVRPELISGGREGVLAYDGATSEFDVVDPVVVSDIGGGSTELVTYDSGVSIDMGSVRLTDRVPERPIPDRVLDTTMDMLAGEFAGASPGYVATHVGVAGTWTSLAAIAQDLPSYDRHAVHGYILRNDQLGPAVDYLCSLTLEETRAIPSLDPNRAAVIAAGAMIALAVTTELDVSETLISDKDTLDGAAMELLALA